MYSPTLASVHSIAGTLYSKHLVGIMDTMLEALSYHSKDMLAAALDMLVLCTQLVVHPLPGCPRLEI